MTMKNDNCHEHVLGLLLSQYYYDYVALILYRMDSTFHIHFIYQYSMSMVAAYASGNANISFDLIFMPNNDVIGYLDMVFY